MRFLFGGQHGEFRFLPPVGFAPAYEALLPGHRLFLSPCKTYGQLNRGHLMGPGAFLQQTVFVPDAVNTQSVSANCDIGRRLAIVRLWVQYPLGFALLYLSQFTRLDCL